VHFGANTNALFAGSGEAIRRITKQKKEIGE
jgi:hypothetical protein